MQYYKRMFLLNFQRTERRFHSMEKGGHELPPSGYFSELPVLCVHQCFTGNNGGKTLESHVPALRELQACSYDQPTPA